MAILLNVFFLIICVLLIIVVLLQRGRGGGLGAAFGGAGSSAFGTRTGDVFTWVTIVLTALFLLLAIGTAVAYRPDLGQVATPVFNPAQQAISEPLRVRILCGTQGAAIHYTTDGSVPTQDSPQYAETPVKVEPGMTLQARAYRAGSDPSEVASASYSLPQVAAPTFDPPAGPLAGPTRVVINTETEEATVHYTTDGNEPTRQSPQYTGPIEVIPTMTLKAAAFHPDPALRDSEVREATYTKIVSAETSAETPADESEDEPGDADADAPADENANEAPDEEAPAADVPAGDGQ
jgi:protein translocase SecG subunit